jgi:hypothetical protein
MNANTTFEKLRVHVDGFGKLPQLCFDSHYLAFLYVLKIPKIFAISLFHSCLDIHITVDIDVWTREISSSFPFAVERCCQGKYLYS